MGGQTGGNGKTRALNEKKDLGKKTEGARVPSLSRRLWKEKRGDEVTMVEEQTASNGSRSRGFLGKSKSLHSGWGRNKEKKRGHNG